MSAYRWLGVCLVLGGSAVACNVVLDINEDYQVGLPTSGKGGVAGQSSSSGGGGAGAGAGAGTGGQASGGNAGCPADMVQLTGYCIDPHEVSRANYDGFLKSNPKLDDQPTGCESNATFEPTANWPPASGQTDLPVVNVDWCDAAVYCAWAGKRLCGAIGGGAITGASFQDATTSQWFAACSQAGTTTFPYGDIFDDALCVGDAYDGVPGYDANTDVLQSVGAATGCRGSTAPYDQIFDISGNVAEWVDSCGAGKCRTPGGAVIDKQAKLKCRSQSDAFMTETSEHIGFRCCADG